MNTADLHRSCRALGIATPAQLARALGSSRQYACDLWNGNQHPSPQVKQCIDLLLKDKAASDG